MTPELYILAASVLGALLVGFGLGRLTNRARRYATELESKLEAQRGELERASQKLLEAGERAKAAEQSLEEYRVGVVEHFSGASELLRDLTLQYRVVYDHLAEGARKLCPDGSLTLEEGIGEILSLDIGPGTSGGEGPEKGPEPGEPDSDGSEPRA